MTQNPYAQFGSSGVGGGDFLEPVERRTSVLAILSLIAGLICFLPGAGVLALILGGAAVILISQSRGRLGGLGLAVTGIVLGLLFSIVWVMMVIGVVSLGQLANQHVFGPIQRVVAGLETGDKAKARSMLTRAADSAITDAQIDDFALRVKDEWGPVQGTAQSLIDIIGDYAAVGQRMQGMQGRNDLFPAPVRFAKGVTIFLLEMDQASVSRSPSGPGGQVSFPVVNMGVIARDGSMIWLIPPAEAVNLKTQIGVPPSRRRGGTTGEPPPDQGDKDDSQAPTPPPGPKPPDE